MKAYLTNLRTDVWRTSSARYNAARRLRRREIFSTLSLAMFSAMSVAIAFIQRIYAAPSSNADNYITTLSASLGIFLLTISLVEWGARTGAMAEALHYNAEQLNSLQRTIALRLALADSGSPVGRTDAEGMAAAYEAVKMACPHNHQPIDDEYFRATQRNAPEFVDASGQARMGSFQACWSGLKWYTASIWYFAVLWLLLIASLALPLIFPEWWVKRT